ncbi:MAG TPA: hypothetical protein PKC30_02610 [Saprospiraceae bacterium]|nr:hypothetical protein [Saprospiraceae bacterium]
MESVAEIQMGSQNAKQNMKLKIDLDFFDKNYRIGAIISGGMIQIDEPIYKYYLPNEKKLYIALQNGSQIQWVPEKQPDFTHLVLTGERESFDGFILQEFTAIYNNKKAKGWYCPDLPNGISPVGFLDIPGALMKLETESTKIQVISIDIVRNINKDELILPEKSIKK